MNQSLKTFSVLSEQYHENPYQYFSYLRESDPVHYEESLDSYFISRYQDVRRVLQNQDVFTTKSLAKRAEPVMRGPVLAQMKGKEHTAKGESFCAALSGNPLITSHRSSKKMHKGFWPRTWRKGGSTLSMISAKHSPFA